jgi:hypothetical protein
MITPVSVKYIGFGPIQSSSCIKDVVWDSDEDSGTGGQFLALLYTPGDTAAALCWSIVSMEHVCRMPVGSVVSIVFDTVN